MPDELVRLFEVTYDGGDAKSRIMEGHSLGQSISGSAQLYSAVAHFCASGVVPRRRYRREFAAYARPSAGGSWRQYWFVAPLIAGEYAIHVKLYNEAISYMFARVTDAVKQIWTRPSEREAAVDKVLEAMKEQGQRDKEIQEQLIAGLVKGQSDMSALAMKLADTLPALASATRTHGIDIVKPVGFTCTEIRQFSSTPALESKITEAEALVIRGGEAMEVDNVATYKLNRIRELNLDTGHCVVDIDGVGAVPGRITDPVLETPNNVYTRRMNDQGIVSVEGKAVRKNGEIQKLFISDAEE